MLVDGFVLSVITGILRRGSIKRLAKIPLRHVYMFVLAFMLKFIIVFWGSHETFVGRYSYYFHLLSYLALFGGFFLNLHIPEIPIISAGSLANFLVIFTNGGKMPVLLSAAQKAGLSPYLEILKNGTAYATHTILSETTRLKFLADIFFIPPPYPKPRVFSIGDVVMVFGVFLLVQRYMVAKDTKQ